MPRLSQHVEVAAAAPPGLRERGPQSWETQSSYLEVVLAMYSEPMAENVPGDHHVGFHTIHGQAVHAQELWQKGIAVTLHYELERKGGKGQVKVPGQTGLFPGSHAPWDSSL